MSPKNQSRRGKSSRRGKADRSGPGKVLGGVARTAGSLLRGAGRGTGRVLSGSFKSGRKTRRRRRR